MYDKRPYFTARLFEDSKILHIRIGKNASSSQHMMMWNEAPDSLDNFDSATIKTNHYDVEIKANTIKDLNAFLVKHFNGYKKSVFIRDPLERFSSSLAQDCSNTGWPVKKTTFNVMNSFESKMEELEKNPSWESLYRIMGVDTSIKNHVILQTDLCNFEALPQDIVYFEVDNNLTCNYLHWLDTSHVISKETNWVNKSNTNSEKSYIKKCVQKYIDNPNSNLLSWIRQAYSNDFDMYQKLKSLCYREGEKHAG